MVQATLIIPAFNAAGFIAATLASACAQTEPDIEILVVDDVSTDDTAAIVERAASRDPRIRLLRMARNGGPSAARNHALAHARGEWIAPLDADDTLAPERIARLVALARHRGADMASDNILLVEQDGGASSPMIPASRMPNETPLDLVAFIAGNLSDPKNPRLAYGFMKPIMRRSFLNAHAIRYDEHVRFAEDFELYVQCLRAGAVWWVTPEPMYRYLVRAGSLTEVQTAADLDRLRGRQRAMLSDPVVSNDPQLKRVLSRHLQGIDRNYFYRAFTDAVKARRFGGALAVLFGTATATRLIALEAARQAPIIVSKALRGGYRG